MESDVVTTDDKSDVESRNLTSKELDTTESGHTIQLVESVQAIGASEWNEVVDRSSTGSVFHRHEWLDAVEGGFDYPPKHLVVRKDNNIIGIFPNFVEPIPKTPFRVLNSVDPEFGGPVITTDDSVVLSLFLDTIPSICRGRTILHRIRANHPKYLRYAVQLEATGYVPSFRKSRMVIDLNQGYDSIIDRMSKSRQQGIESGHDVDYEIVREDVTLETLRRFYRSYSRQMNTLEAEPYSFLFFEGLLPIESRLLHHSIYIEGDYAGGFLDVLDDQQSTIYSFLAGVPKEYYDYHATELLIEHVIKWGIDNGYDAVDFGGAPSNYENGLFRFKESFGGALVPTFIWERACGLSGTLCHAGLRAYWRRSRDIER